MPLGRLEAFSDGVGAIASTLLVLELGVGVGAKRHLLSSILHEWPAYLAYVTSFLTIGVVWLQHAEITRYLRAADPLLYRINLLVLLLASFLPFPTKLAAQYLGENDTERVAAAFYGLCLLALSLALTAYARYAASNTQLLKEAVDAKAIEKRSLRHSPGLALYAVGIAITLVAPTAGVILYLVSAVVRGLPAGPVRHLVWRVRDRIRR